MRRWRVTEQRGLLDGVRRERRAVPHRVVVGTQRRDRDPQIVADIRDLVVSRVLIHADHPDGLAGGEDDRRAGGGLARRPVRDRFGHERADDRIFSEAG